jgi:hypothetical protein
VRFEEAFVYVMLNAKWIVFLAWQYSPSQGFYLVSSITSFITFLVLTLKKSIQRRFSQI